MILLLMMLYLESCGKSAFLCSIVNKLKSVQYMLQKHWYPNRFLLLLICSWCVGAIKRMFCGLSMFILPYYYWLQVHFNELLCSVRIFKQSIHSLVFIPPLTFWHNPTFSSAILYALLVVTTFCKHWPFAFTWELITCLGRQKGSLWAIRARILS